MSVALKQSTQITVRVGSFVDVSDGFTPETGVTLSGADEAELLKANGAATVDISGATWAAVTGADGWYDLTLTASHTDTVGELVVVVQDDSVCLPVWMRFQVVEETVYDALYASGANAGADALLDLTDGVESGLTVRQYLRLAAAVLLGKASGMGTTTNIFRDTTDTKDRVTATTDGDGNRSAVTLDPS